MKLSEIEKLVDNNEIDKAWSYLDLELSNPNRVETYMVAGTIKMKQQKYGDALNFFYKILEIDAQNIKAKSKIDVIKRILNISNSFYYENTYLDDSLYE